MSSVLDEVDAVEPAPDILSVTVGARPAFLLGIDVGTSGVRAALFDDRGSEIAGASSRTLRHLAAFSDLGVLDADAIVAQVIETIDDLIVSRAEAHGVRFIAISCFWHSLIGVDQNGRPTTPLLSWADTRAAKSAALLTEQFDEQEAHRRSGCRFHASYWPAKLHWLQQEQKEVFEGTNQWLGFSEYLCGQLFDSTSMSVSMASATGLFDQRKCEWDWKFINSLKIPKQSLPNIARENDWPPLSSEFADRWPALSEARLVTIIGDGAANNIGGGCCTRDRFALMVGTSGAMRVMYAGNPPDRLPFELWSYRADRSRVVVGGALSDGGGLYRWLTDLMCLGDDPEIEKQLADLDADSHGLTILPFWSGERSTGWSAEARGAILGLTQQTKPVEILRAAMEAVAYRFALIARALETLTGTANIVATGNALRASRVWLQIMADVLGQRLNLTSVREASTRGAALLALETLGKIENLEQHSITIEEIVEPDMSRHRRYLEGLARQTRTYETIVRKL
jgi:gluconokinase